MHFELILGSLSLDSLTGRAHLLRSKRYLRLYRREKRVWGNVMSLFNFLKIFLHVWHNPGSSLWCTRFSVVWLWCFSFFGLLFVQGVSAIRTCCWLPSMSAMFSSIYLFPLSRHCSTSFFLVFNSVVDHHILKEISLDNPT